MEMQEWALIIFTILAQMSVGAFVVLGILHAYALRKSGVEQADNLSDNALLAIGPVMALGLVASIFHLGSPMQATQAIANVGSSWLSREILFGVLFAGLGFVFAFLQWRKIGDFGMRRIVAVVAALAGLALVYSMSQVYMLPTHPSWNTLATPLLFFVTTSLLGLFAVGSALYVNFTYLKRKSPKCLDTQCQLLQEAVRGIAFASLILMGIELVTIPLQLALLGSSPISQANYSVALTYNQFGLLFALRLVLVFVGAGLFAFIIYRKSMSEGSVNTLGTMVLSAFTLVLAAEMIGRFLFYATQVKIGI